MTQDKRLMITGVVILMLLYLFLTVFQGSPDGAKIFVREGCINCHSFRGKGGEMGPDLTGVSQRRTEKWIRDQIRNSKLHNKNSMMPSFSHLSYREVNALIKFLNGPDLSR